MTIAFRRISSVGNQPFLTGFIAWEHSAADSRIYYAVETISREFIRESLARYGVHAVRALIRSIRAELSDEVRERIKYVSSDTAAVTFLSKPRTHERWLEMMGFPAEKTA